MTSLDNLLNRRDEIITAMKGFSTIEEVEAHADIYHELPLVEYKIALLEESNDRSFEF